MSLLTFCLCLVLALISDAFGRQCSQKFEPCHRDRTNHSRTFPVEAQCECRRRIDCTPSAGILNDESRTLMHYRRPFVYGELIRSVYCHLPQKRACRRKDEDKYDVAAIFKGRTMNPYRLVLHKQRCRCGPGDPLVVYKRYKRRSQYWRKFICKSHQKTCTYPIPSYCMFVEGYKKTYRCKCPTGYVCNVHSNTSSHRTRTGGWRVKCERG